MDTRAQSIGIARYFLSLLVGVVLYWILQKVVPPILDGSRAATTNSTANQASDWIAVASEWFIIFVLVISTIGLIVYSIYVREVKR